MGISFYGYDWVEENGTDVLYDEVLETIKENNITVAISDESEKFFSYVKDDEDHTVYFADSETVTERLDFVQEYDLGGISIWRVGGEDKKIWTEISDKL